MKVTSLHLFDRSNPNDIIAYNPTTKRNYSRIEDIRECIAKYGYFAGRTDIVLINVTESCNCGSNCCSGKKNTQYVIQANKNGQLVSEHPDIATLLADDQLQQARTIANKMFESASKHPEMGNLLVNNSAYYYPV